jgi:predicted metal-dependent hydrolase
MIPIDEVIRTKRKSIALIVQRDGRLVVRAPRKAKDDDIRALVEKKAKWINAKQELVKSIYPPYVPKEFVNGEGFLYLGQTYRLEIVEPQRPALVLNGNFQLANASLPKAARIFEGWYRDQALRIISERVRWYAENHGYSHNQVKITSARTRWGSCSSKGTLSFTWRLVMAPVPVIDYVAVHELVHMREKNHSKEFWGRVKLVVPDYKQRIEWLELNGHLLRL